jgi:hypothetical protein
VSDPISPKEGIPAGIVARPPGQLHDLPLEARWEVTRRNPYYLVFWAQARAFRRAELSVHPAEGYLRYAAHLILAQIGVTGEPVSPETSGQELIGSDNAALDFLTGTVQPVTFRGVVSMLLNGLPPVELEAVGDLLRAAGRGEYEVPEDAPPDIQKKLASVELTRLISVNLDSFAEIPLFYVHLGASQNSILRDTGEQVRRWKKRRGLGSPKVQAEKIDLYLKVWDLREGWTGAGYDRARERTFANITKTLGIGPISKVVSRYRAAFRLISGHDFSPELWWRLVGPLKFSKFLGDPIVVLSDPIRHRFSSPGPKPVPESVISPATDDVSSPGIVASSATVDRDITIADLLMDLETLIDRGLSDDEVATKLELSDSGLVAYYRTRIKELRSL